MKPKNKPHPIDIYVGERIKLRRRALELSQDKVAKLIGVTFQQMQKYEKGTNRTSASKLYEISKALSVPIQYFFDDFNDEEKILQKAPIKDNRFLNVLVALKSIKKKKILDQLIDLIFEISKKY